MGPGAWVDVLPCGFGLAGDSNCRQLMPGWLQELQSGDRHSPGASNCKLVGLDCRHHTPAVRLFV